MGAPADARHGEAIFRRECMACHKIGNTGRAVGPDLTASSFRDPAALLTQVLDPNVYVPPNYESYICIDNDGRVITGILTAQTATSVTLTQQEGVAATILRTNIESLNTTGKSLMPEGFERTITKEEMRDLIGYLQSAQGPAAASPLEVGTLPAMVEPEK